MSVSGLQFWTRFFAVQYVYSRYGYDSFLVRESLALTRIDSPRSERSTIQRFFRALVMATYRNFN